MDHFGFHILEEQRNTLSQLRKRKAFLDAEERQEVYTPLILKQDLHQITNPNLSCTSKTEKNAVLAKQVEGVS
jgi:hypothetical protein